MAVARSLAVYAYYLARGKKAKAMRHLFDDFYSFGGLYIKFLQLLVLRGDFSDIDVGELRDALAVFDQNQYEPINLRATLNIDLGPQAARLHLLSETPVAAGSFGQVYQAYLDGSTPVIIKILRPSVSKYLRFDLRVLSAVGRLLMVFKADGFLNFSAILREFKQITLAETDYVAEARTANQVYERLTGNPVITIPRTFSDLCSPRVLVQEQVQGVPLSELMARVQPENLRQYVREQFNTNLDDVMEALAYESLAAAFEEGGAHGDPHPGNIYINRDNQIALIDFGIVSQRITRKTEMLGLLSEYVSVYNGQFSPERFTLRMMAFFVPQLTRSLYVISRATGVNMSERVLTLLGDMAGQELRNQQAGSQAQQLLDNYKVLAIFMNVINHDNRFSIKADIESMAFMRGSIMYLHLSDRLCLGRQAVGRAYQRILQDYGDQRTDYHVSYGVDTLDESYHFIASWLERLQYSDPISYSKIARVMR